MPSPSFPDRVRVHPAPLGGEVRVPGDKSISHRSLLLGALAEGGSDISGLAPSGDVASTAAVLRHLGVEVVLVADPADGSLHGRVEGPLREADDVLDCGNSGTSLRLLSGVVAGIDGIAVLTGDSSLRRRPVDRVRRPLEAMGAHVDARDGGRLPPVVIRGGGLHGIDYTSPVASAQVKSCVLLAGLTASGRTRVTSPLVSRDHTERMLTHLGAAVTTEIGDDGREVVTLEPGRLVGRPLAVPRDPSAAAFWLVAAMVPGAGTITAHGVCANPTRLGAVAVLRDLGAAIELTAESDRGGEPVATITARPSPLGGTEVAGRAVVDALDELPVLALAGALAEDGLEVRDAAELRVKESDRISVLATTFAALGMVLEERADGYRVPGGQQPRGGQIDAHGDHRIAMTACIAGTAATAPVEVSGFAAVATSYPGFIDDFRALGGRIEAIA